ncbi:hypothetical protein [Streptomyces chrestomyceticus]|uniref:hypothetical protein n=1 Tax=Streptomyces chrestomyceticus TaxID=68185 RepID=UPI0019D0974D|nr:hypothetical protein [Streptomyces chrestomyceticus]
MGTSAQDPAGHGEGWRQPGQGPPAASEQGQPGPPGSPYAAPPPPPPPRRRRKGCLTCGIAAAVGAVIVLVVIVVLVVSVGGKDESGGSGSSGTPSASAGKGRITKEMYDRVRTGMTEREVTAITGPCESSAEDEVAGIRGKVLTCRGAEAFSAATFTFSNGRLAAKGQVGLGGDAARKGSMTKEKYDRLRTGMSLKEALAVAGACEKDSDTDVAGSSATGYTCTSADGLGNASLVFADGKLTAKAQTGLE